MHLVKSVRINGQPRQERICSFGDINDPKYKDKIQEMLSKGLDLFEDTLIISELRSKDLVPLEMQIIGPVIIFDRIWKDLKIDMVINSLVKGRKFSFNPERVLFASVLQRLIEPGSDNALINWIKNYKIEDCEDLQLQYCYRTMNWLGEPIETKDIGVANRVNSQEPDLDTELDTELIPEETEGKALKMSGAKWPNGAKEAKSVRCVKDRIEEEIYFKRRNLLTQISLAYFDTTSIYFEDKDGIDIGCRGHSKEHRTDPKQAVVGVVLDNHGYPVCTEIWPGNTADVTTMVPMAKRLRSGFGIDRVCLLADRGMISKNIIEQITNLGWTYILGVKMRNDSVVPDLFQDEEPFIEVVKLSVNKHNYVPLRDKEVLNEGNRYVIYFNEEDAEYDRYTRGQIITNLEEALKDPENMIRSKSYQKFIRVLKDSVIIDPDNIENKARFDGIYILRTNSTLSAPEIALKYKELINLECLFREFTTLFNTRPVYHQTDNNIRGHIWVSFLAFLLKKSLLSAIDKAKKDTDKPITWENIINDLNNVSQGIIQSGSKRFLMGTKFNPGAARAFKALGIAFPKTVTRLEDAPVTDDSAQTPDEETWTEQTD